MSEEMKKPTYLEAAQRHSDHYIPILMTEKDEAKLYLEFGQIAEAVRRLKNEEVGSKYHPGLVEAKFLELVDIFIPAQLNKLIEGTAQKEDLSSIDEAVKSVEKGEYKYPVNAEFLRQKFFELRASFS